jgi:hypothetical protein
VWIIAAITGIMFLTILTITLSGIFEGGGGGGGGGVR